MASRTDRVMKPSQWEQLGLTLRREKRSRRRGNPRGGGLDAREILPRLAKEEKCLLTSPSIGLSHSYDGYGYMSEPKNQNRTDRVLQKPDILTCYEHKAENSLPQRTVGGDNSIKHAKSSYSRLKSTKIQGDPRAEDVGRWQGTNSLADPLTLGRRKC